MELGPALLDGLQVLPLSTGLLMASIALFPERKPSIHLGYLSTEASGVSMASKISTDESITLTWGTAHID